MQSPQANGAAVGRKGALFYGFWALSACTQEGAPNPGRDPTTGRWQSRGILRLACLRLSSTALVGVLPPRPLPPGPDTNGATMLAATATIVSQQSAQRHLSCSATQGQSEEQEPCSASPGLLRVSCSAGRAGVCPRPA